MNKTLIILVLILPGFWVSCKKDKDDKVIHQPLPTPGLDDKAVVFLKDVVEQGLPSPYFHFNYNDSGYTTNINFADGFFDYDISYNNKRVAFMVNKKITPGWIINTQTEGQPVSVRHLQVNRCGFTK